MNSSLHIASPRIAAVVILYHPDNNLLEHLQTYVAGVEKIFVFDNTEAGTPLAPALRQLSKVVYQYDGANEGIAKRLNEACYQALDQGFDWLLTMDQDTCFDGDLFSQYLECFQQYEAKEKVAFFCTDYSMAPAPAKDCQPVDADNAITSGSLLNLSLVNTVGGFDENLFIDSVDHDYLIRSRLAGFRVIQFFNIIIRHRLGQEVHRASIKTFYLAKKNKIVHSPLRCYYMYRNLLYLEKKFAGADDALLKKLRKIVTGNLKNNLLYGRQIRQVSQQLIAAYQDFSKGRMGKKRDSHYRL